MNFFSSVWSGGLFFCRAAGFLPALLGLLLILSAVETEAFYCASKIVSVGDRKYEVREKCGDPTYRRFRREAYVDHEDEVLKRVAHSILEEWVYDFGPRRLIRVLTFRHNVLQAVEQGGYGTGFPSKADPTCSDGQRFSVGDSEFETLRRCGPPASRSRREVELRQPLEGTLEKRVLVSVEEWTYNFGPRRLMHVLEFRDGRIARIEARGYGF